MQYFVKLMGGGGWGVYKTSLTPPLFIEVPVKSQKSELSCICVRGIDFVSFYDFSIGLWPCSYSVVFFVFLLDCGPVPTVWYFLFFYWIVARFLQCGIFCFSIGLWPCSYSVVFFVFLLDCGPFPTVWYFLFFYWIVALFLQCGIFCFSIGLWPCSYSVVFFVFLLDCGPVPTVFIAIFQYKCD